ncbi:MAG: hypothetical protein JXA21_05720 [Anaerolineae bacterium]|nr:hypothetical protein [Anaerolineae bacterium]
MLSKPSAGYTVLILGILISLAATLASPEIYHHWDLNAFWKWSQQWDRGWRDVYRNCRECNYPIVGMAGSAGVMSRLGDNAGEAIARFRIVLAVVDGLNVLLLFGLFRKLAVPNAAFWAGIVGLLFSSWTGGALWGQIDGILQCFILLTLFWMVSNTQKPQNPLRRMLLLLVGSALMACALLTKQLALFSLPSLGLLLATIVVFSARNWRSAALTLALAGVCLVACLLVADVFLRLPAPYRSHLYYIFKTGSDQGDEIARNGFNLWIFLGRPMRSSSHVAIFLKAATPLAAILTPYNVGFFLFSATNLILGASQLLFLRTRFLKGETAPDRETLLSLILHLALVNLSFNVFLTGTHERYLYHFYPYAILACLGLKAYSHRFSNTTLGLLIAGAVLYGLFVLGVLVGMISLQKTGVTMIVGIYHAMLWGYLFVVVLNYQQVWRSLRKH